MSEHIFGMTNLGSGSSGNATVIHGPAGKFLIDAGFSAKELASRMTDSGIAPEEIRAILISHAHTDHTKGSRVFAEHYGVPIYTTGMTARRLSRKDQLPKAVSIFMPGSEFELCGISVEPFLVSHDADETVGFVLECGGFKMAVATDMGVMNPLERLRMTACDVLMMESNYDKKMLADSTRPLRLKRRIFGKFGHLSNDEALDELKNLLTDRTRVLIFGHLSQECNDRTMLQELAFRRLKELNRSDIRFEIASQDSPLPTIWAE